MVRPKTTIFTARSSCPGQDRHATDGDTLIERHHLRAAIVDVQRGYAGRPDLDPTPGIERRTHVMQQRAANQFRVGDQYDAASVVTRPLAGEVRENARLHLE